MSARRRSCGQRLPGSAKGRFAARRSVRRETTVYGYQGCVRSYPHFAACCIGGLILMLILIILLLVLLFASVPAWGYSESWGYYPSGTIGLILIILIIMMMVGRF